jgi:hypothetical protein
VTVKGNTGICEHRGTLILVGAHSSRTVAGKFTTSLSVPPGTVPGDHHQLLLSVFCPGGEQEARFNLVVENQPPTPGNDEASTVPGKPVTIPVTRNDTDPDDPDGYATRLEEASPGPSHGTVAVQGGPDRLQPRRDLRQSGGPLHLRLLRRGRPRGHRLRHRHRDRGQDASQAT